MARWNVRCSKEACRARHVFDKHPDEYQRPRKCKCCGGTKFRIVKNRFKDRCATLCTCMGYRWGDAWTGSNAPHNRGSRFCYYRKDGTLRMPGDADFEDPNYEPEMADEAA
jgi:hypothetical protein